MGPLTGGEVRELLREGFLLPADLYWEAGMAEWDELRKFESGPSTGTKGPALVELAKQTVSSAAKSAATRASGLTRMLQLLAGRGHDRLGGATTRWLDSFSPQIQKLVSNQVLRQSITRAREAVHDDEFMRKFFGAVYDCLPKPVCRFVTEKAFIRYCMERRFKLLGMEAPGTGSKSEPAGSRTSGRRTFTPDKRDLRGL